MLYDHTNVTKPTFTRHQTNFHLTEQFDRTLRSHGTFNIFALFTRNFERLGV